MDVVIQHVQEHLAIYVTGGAVLLPLLYVFRYWTFPVLFHGSEIAFYLAIFHFITGGLVRFFWYFKSQTQMENALGPAEAQANWTTPINLEFWKRDRYEPEWLFFFEIGAAVCILFLVYKFRPVKYNRKNRYKGKDGGQGGQYTTKKKSVYLQDFH